MLKVTQRGRRKWPRLIHHARQIQKRNQLPAGIHHRPLQSPVCLLHAEGRPVADRSRGHTQLRGDAPHYPHRQETRHREGPCHGRRAARQKGRHRVPGRARQTRPRRHQPHHERHPPGIPCRPDPQSRRRPDQRQPRFARPGKIHPDHPGRGPRCRAEGTGAGRPGRVFPDQDQRRHREGLQ